MTHEIENFIKEIEFILKIPSRNSAAEKYSDSNFKNHERGSNRKREIETGMRKKLSNLESKAT